MTDCNYPLGTINSFDFNNQINFCTKKEQQEKEIPIVISLEDFQKMYKQDGGL